MMLQYEGRHSKGNINCALNIKPLRNIEGMLALKMDTAETTDSHFGHSIHREKSLQIGGS